MESNISEYIQEYCSCLHEWDAAYEDYAKSVGLNYSSLCILSEIYKSDGCTQKQLCSLCFLPKQTVNAAVTGFYNKGWLMMRELPEDRRNKTLHLTELGKREAEHILQNLQECDRIAISALTADEQAQLISLTRRYMSACVSAMKRL